MEGGHQSDFRREKIIRAERREFAHNRDSVNERIFHDREPIAHVEFGAEHEEFLCFDTQTAP